jgi:hypothetical protein
MRSIELGERITARAAEILRAEGKPDGDYFAVADAMSRAYSELTATASEGPEERPAAEEIHRRAREILRAQGRAETYENYLAACERAEAELRVAASKPKGDRFDEEIRSIKAALDRLAPKDETYTVEARERFTVRAIMERVA